ncbi:hypothetical protein HYW41_05190 [Candidatus Daviesbacteria bacterium]|nr:hypothetical protein [Candidatus Daviesbacteria bacterium]
MFWLKIFLCLSLYTVYSILYTPLAFAIVDPLSVPNNKYGIHIIQATPEESSPAAQLVNSSEGNWGYITVLIEGKDKNKDKWQAFFDDLRRRHLIPIVRLATIPDGNFWKRPDEGEAKVWADFLDSLNWPVKNRYVIIYNEPNHAAEWGNFVDAKSYAKVLDQTITALKGKNQDFFVLNAGLDASAPHELPNYQDQVSFMTQMNEAAPGIFEELDGWVSHSYPNPGFVGSPDANGRGTVRTFLWELQQLKNLGVTKNLPVFITETGWKHAEGLIFDSRLPKAENLSDYYINAFTNAWQSSRIVAVTPFLLNYQQSPFDHFSFKDTSSQFYPFYQQIMSLPKIAGKPVQDRLAKLVKGEIYSSIVAGETYTLFLTFKNTGQSIWNDETVTSLIPLEGGAELGISKVEIPKEVKVEPGKEYTFNINLKAPQKGSFKIKLNLFSDAQQFDSKPLEFTTEVKLPVILQVLGNLKWKKSPAADYVLRVSGVVGDSVQKINLDSEGKSPKTEARYLLPDYSFGFTLEKPYYYPKTLHQTLKTGVNVLDFGTLQPALLPALLHPAEFWKLLPWSN